LKRVKSFIDIYFHNRKRIIQTTRSEISLTKGILLGIRDSKTHIGRLELIMGWLSNRNKRYRYDPVGHDSRFWLNIFDYKMYRDTIEGTSRKVLIACKDLINKSRNIDSTINTEKELGVGLSQSLEVASVSPIRHRYNRQRFRSADKDYLCFVHHKDRKTVEKEIYFMKSVRGSWATNRHDLSGYGIEQKTKIGDAQEYFNIIKSSLKKKVVPQIHYIPVSSDLLQEGVNPYADSGFITSLICGKDKRTAFHTAVKDSRRLFMALLNRQIYDTSIWKIGGRDRVVKGFKDDGAPLRSRAVLSPEMCVSQIAQLFGRKITKGYQYIQRFFEYDNQLGADLLHGRYFKHVEKFKQSKYIISCDWSKYDQFITETEIVVAFGEIRSYFPVSEFLDRLFIFIISGFIHTHILGDGGIIYRKHRGNPTGHPFTSIINTLVNEYRWKYFTALTGIEFSQRAFYGDDGQLGCNDNRILSYDIEGFFMEHFGAKITVGAINNFNDRRSVENTPDFLKTYSYFGMPSRTNENLEELISIERKAVSKTYGQKINRLYGLLFSSCFKHEHIRRLEVYHDYLVEQWKERRGQGLKLNTFTEIFHRKLTQAQIMFFLDQDKLFLGSETTETLWLPGSHVLEKSKYMFWKFEE
jgi:hypothetical protein